MNKARKTKAVLIIGLLCVLVCTHLPVAYTHWYHTLTGMPKAREGMIDLSAVELSKPIVLDGSWAFYWDRLIVTEPRQEDAFDFFINVPDYWSKYKLNGWWLPANGVASYRIGISGLNRAQDVALYIPDFGSAYRIFIDGVLTAESGTVTRQMEAVFTVPKAKLYPVKLSQEKTHEVVIEVATTRFSGLYMAPVLGDYSSMVSSIENRSETRLILFGTLLFSLLSLIVIFMLSIKKGLQMAWVPAMAFFVLLRMMLTTEFYSFWQNRLFFNLSYEATNELMFLSTFILNFLLIFLIQAQFDNPFDKKEKIGFFLYYTTIYLVYLFVPQGFYNRHLTVLIPVLAFALEFYAFFKVYYGWHRIQKYGMFIYGGVLMAISGLIIDCYYINGNIYMNLSMTMLTLLSVYMMVVSLVYALRMAEAYNELIASSAMLDMARRQITAQKTYYETLSGQFNEIRAIKHDMRHFITVIKQLSSEGQYQEVQQFVDAYAIASETEPLLVFCENVVANSIIGYYSLRAKEQGVDFRGACSIDKRLSISDSDLCIVLGNALENALEACIQMADRSEAFIHIEARTTCGQLLVKIDNAFSGYIDEHDGEFISTKKGENHGIGVRNMKQVVEAYGGYVKMTYSEHVFTLMAAFHNAGFSESEAAQNG